jgi:hypothetical protein
MPCDRRSAKGGRVPNSALGEATEDRNMRLAAVATAASAILLLGACSGDDDSSTTTTESSTTTQAPVASPTTLAQGEDIELVGGPESGLGNQTLNIDANADNGEVTGEFRVTDNVIRVDCADTLRVLRRPPPGDSVDGVIILGGEVTEGPDFAIAGQKVLMALIIKEGDPDSVSLYANEGGADSCTELLESIPDDLLANQSNFVEVEDGYEIETG